MRVFVATDSRMGRAERVLEYSIHRNTPEPVEITWMRADDPGWTVGDTEDCDWQIGRPNSVGPYSGKGWATQFSGFRWAVPELAGFEGRALYMDVDMLVVADLRELFSVDMLGQPALTEGARTCVTLFDASRFKDVDWPSIEEMKRSGNRPYVCRHKLQAMGGLGGLPPGWNTLDHYEEGKTKIVHYTNMRTQPWHPYPDVFPYDKEHKCSAAVDLWNRYESLSEQSQASV